VPICGNICHTFDLFSGKDSKKTQTQTQTYNNSVCLLVGFSGKVFYTPLFFSGKVFYYPPFFSGKVFLMPLNPTPKAVCSFPTSPLRQPLFITTSEEKVFRLNFSTLRKFNFCP
jgi:hypothetical protein